MARTRTLRQETDPEYHEQEESQDQQAEQEDKEQKIEKPTGKIDTDDLPDPLSNDYYTYTRSGTVQARYDVETDVYVVVTKNEDGENEGEYVDAEDFNRDYIPLSPAQTPA